MKMSKEEHRAVKAEQYIERCRERAATTPGDGPKMAYRLALQGWTPDRIAAATDLNANDLRHYFAGAPLPRDVAKVLRGLLERSVS